MDYELILFRNCSMQNDSVKKSVEPLLADMAENDPKTLVRARAIEALGKI
jgi:hypothetical protein